MARNGRCAVRPATMSACAHASRRYAFSPLTSLPVHLVTEKPAAAISATQGHRLLSGDATWLIKRQAVSVPPARFEAQTLGRVSDRDPGARL